jgi:hypothetical protein
MNLQITAFELHSPTQEVPLQSSKVHQHVVVVFRRASASTRQYSRPIIKIRSPVSCQMTVELNTLLPVDREGAINDGPVNRLLLSAADEPLPRELDFPLTDLQTQPLPLLDHQAKIQQI